MASSITQPRRWTKQDDEYLIQNYGSYTAKQLMKTLGFPLNTIYINVRKLGLNKKELGLAKTWSKDDLKYLIDNYKTKPCSILADHFSVSEGTIYRKARELGLRKFNSSIWTEKLDKIFKKNYATCTIKELAGFFGVSELVVRQRAKKFRLKRPGCIQQSERCYICPQCMSLIWVKPNLRIVCGDCNVAYEPGNRKVIEQQLGTAK
ncbi:MAG: hypothetical protein FWD67_11595 [Betaproteobacteria bacterium]|nr:hypothetical protein [Betaproteobacteria bacterium]